MFENLFCKHQWETIRELTLENDEGQVIALGFLQKCSKCGKLNYREFHLNSKSF